ncbi:hypothetical protein [Dyadobacter sp. NIV53]|uniref:hypothetical protein n=1 Tax=Dyadobacter sp. NIV53 TaxID=2861765 RepID=UPI001E3549F3|nr:hypothetical protein [Dyadobacter sp. NIV53]
MKKHLLWLALSLMMSHILKAQTIDLVRDINVTGTGTGVTILETAASGNILFFSVTMVFMEPSSGRATGLRQGHSC